ncbi:MAG: hypothetical protein ACFBRM_07630 [Pikeienuella sp.]
MTLRLPSSRLAGLLLLGALAACEDGDFYDDAPPPNSGGLQIAEMPRLTAAQVRIFLSDSTLVHRDKERVWTVYVDPTGELRGLSETRSNEPGTVQGRGSWTVLGDGRVCREWQGVWDTQDTGCAFVRQQGDVYMFHPVEDPDGRALARRREPGNPRGL